jgi:prepilin-type N-terminal cleavage/methylation domain-containing protein
MAKAIDQMAPRTRGLGISRPGFTLVEMLVVIGIIAVLAALLLPAVMRVVNSGRNTAIALEVNQLASAIEAYKQDKGDYPPNFRDRTLVERHIRKCYPKIDPNYFQAFMNAVFPSGVNPLTNPVIDEGESLVFWLAMTDSDPRYPFLSYLNPASLTPNPKKYHDFDQTRLVNSAPADRIPCYRAKFSKDSCYIYIDSRSYLHTCRIPGYGGDTIATYAYADTTSDGVRPYWSDVLNPSATTTLPRDRFKPVNPTTFQIICAGQDGEFGYQSSDMDVKRFPTGDNYNAEDRDNITNFSNGRTLADNLP